MDERTQVESENEEEKASMPAKNSMEAQAEKRSVNPMHIVEAALFSAGRPLSTEEIHDATGLQKDEVRNCMQKLQKDYRRRDTVIDIARVGDKFAMQLKTEYAEHAVRLANMEIPVRLLKTLALIAYHQPIKQSSLSDMEGAKAYEHIKELAELGMIRKKQVGRTLELSTTRRFVEYFGIEARKPHEIKRYLAKKVGINIEELEKKAAEIKEKMPSQQDQPEQKLEPLQQQQ